MKKSLALFVFCLITCMGYSQKTLLVEKIGTGQKYFYHEGNYFRIRVSKQDTLLAGKLWSIQDSVIAVNQMRPFDVRISEIKSVYKRFEFPRKLGKYLVIGSAAICGIIVINHLVNHERVLAPDLVYVSGPMLGAGLLSLSLDRKRCRIGNRWKIKILDISVN
ncbi:MAG: hypothetical protein WCK34_14925 [Bacteroidota bacterium]